MDYCKLDPDLISWGVAVQEGGWTVRASKSKGDAEIDAAAAGGMLAYYNPEGGWTFAATGQRVPYGRSA